MKVGFVGAGKVSTAFGIYLKEKGIEVYGYYSRSYESAKQAALLTYSKPEYDICGIAKNCDIIFITTNDDQIANATRDLAGSNMLEKNTILAHMSGALTSSILNTENKNSVFSIHPIQSFADIKKSVRDLPNTVFSIEGDIDKEGFETIKELFSRIGNEYFVLNKEQKPLYHAANCVFSNYLVTLMDYGVKIFEKAGIEQKQGFRAVLPLINGTLANIRDLGTEAALTGPVARGDSETVKQHIKALENSDGELSELYKILARKTLLVAKGEKLKDNEKIEAILKEVK